MNTDLSLLTLILDASIVVKAVMLLLLLASIASWAVIIEKSRLLKQAAGAADEFEATFWSGGDLATMHSDIVRGDIEQLGMAGIFESGFSEFGRLNEQAAINADQIVEGSRRSMRVSQLREVDRLEHHLAFLATVGSTSPYVGLFGTVWGIMNSFQALGNVHQATLAMVAPGISEALIATAMGLFAAIPAVIGYNRFSTHVENLESSYANFMEEFSNILQRQAYSEKEAV